MKRNDLKILKSLSFSFLLLSGNYVTFPTQEYKAAELPFMKTDPDDWFYTRKYSQGINNHRMPAFHHLDISYQIRRERNNKSNIWNFSIYNVYNKMNIYSIYKYYGEIKQVTFFPMIPSVTFTRTF